MLNTVERELTLRLIVSDDGSRSIELFDYESGDEVTIGDFEDMGESLWGEVNDWFNFMEEGLEHA